MTETLTELSEAAKIRRRSTGLKRQQFAVGLAEAAKTVRAALQKDQER